MMQRRNTSHRVRREIVSVAAMRASQWSQILSKAEAVLDSTDGLKESIAQRQRVAMYWRQSALVGVITFDLRHEHFQGNEVVAIYSGNAWLHESCRGMNLIPSLGIRCYSEALLRWPRALHYWFFGSNSYLSYLKMTRNLAVCYPSRKRATPPWEYDYLRYLAKVFYRTELEPGSYVYSMADSRQFRELASGVPTALREDENVQHFLTLNPHFARGDKLMCLAPLTLLNWTQIGVRTLRRPLGMGRNKRHPSKRR